MAKNKNLDLQAVPGKYWADPDIDTQDDHPVTCVSYYDAVRYTDWLNTQRSGLIPEGWKFSLPTDVQWEYACRADTETEFFWGSNYLEDGYGYANVADIIKVNPEKLFLTNWSSTFPFSDGYSFTSPVYSFNANPWGFYDMVGNVFEWTRTPIVYDKGDENDSDASQEIYIVRGSCFTFPPSYSRSAQRTTSIANRTDFRIGFRVAIVKD